MKKTLACTMACAVLAAAAGSASAAEFVVVPEANANERGNGGLNTLTRGEDFPRTYQQQYTEAELSAQGLEPGMEITGISWRSSISASNDPEWPPAGGATWDDYEITFAEAANPISAMSSTYADNMTNPVMVQSGELHIAEGTFTNTSPPAPEPNEWGPIIEIEPYEYQGGDLVVLYTHNGSNIPGHVFLDRVGSDDAWGRAISATSFQAPSGGNPTASFTITRFAVGGEVCIADWNGDGEVDVNDFFAYLDDFEAGDPRADLNNDGEIDINDFFIFLSEFEAGC